MNSLRRQIAGLGIDREALITVLTGAGVSAESGVPTFRGEGGFWKTYKAEELATPEAFQRDPVTVWEWYDYRRQICSGIDPNPAHSAITRLDEGLPSFLLLTQNVDGLHRRAGTRRIVELHGNLFRVRCTRCGEISENRNVPIGDIPPECHCGGMLRPDVVWFGETLPEAVLSESFEASRSCGLMLVVGTSAVVQPAASMPLLAKQAGAHMIEINPDPTPVTPYADIHLSGKAGEILPGVVDLLLESDS